MTDDAKKKKSDRSRFVQEGTEGMTIDGVPIEEYVQRPEVKAAIAKLGGRRQGQSRQGQGRRVLTASPGRSWAA